jgi:hypothetical protein
MTKKCWRPRYATSGARYSCHTVKSDWLFVEKVFGDQTDISDVAK